jgi:hypothetical protein
MEDSRQSLLMRFKSILAQFDPITTTTVLSLDCWQMFAEETIGDPLNSQAMLEYVAGLYSKMPERTHSKSRPNSEQISSLKSLFYEISQSYTIAELERVASLTKQTDVFSSELSHSVFAYFHYARGEGYPHRLLEAFTEKYSLHDDYLRQHYGLTAEQISEFFQHLFLLASKSVNDYLTNLKDALSEIPEVYKGLNSGSISPNDLRSMIDGMRRKDLDDMFLSSESTIPHILQIPRDELETRFRKPLVDASISRFARHFGEMNLAFDSPTEFNELNATPVILMGNSLFLPVPQLLYQAPLRTMYYDLIKDEEYASKFEKSIGNFQEGKTSEFFSRVFGKDRVHHSLRYGDENQFETDILVTFDDRLLIVESKSKRLTASAKLGNYDQIIRDFSGAVQDAYNQAIRTKKYIESSELARFTTQGGDNIVLKRNDFAAIYIVCVTSESYSALLTEITRLLEKDHDGPYPWVVSILDLEIACDYISNPYMFIHFLERRIQCYGKMISFDELDYVGAYLMHGLPFPPEWKNASNVILSGFAEKLNGEYLKSIGIKYETPPLRAPDRPEFRHILQTLQTYGGKGHTSAIILLLELDEERRAELVDAISQVSKLTAKDHKRHDVTLVYQDCGISFLAANSRVNMRNQVINLGILKKYKHKRRAWLSLGRAMDDSRFLVNEFCHIKSEWEYDSELEALSKYLSGTKTD